MTKITGITTFISILTINVRYFNGPFSCYVTVRTYDESHICAGIRCINVHFKKPRNFIHEKCSTNIRSLTVISGIGSAENWRSRTTCTPHLKGIPLTLSISGPWHKLFSRQLKTCFKFVWQNLLTILDFWKQKT